jgi:hypothetical protein
VAGRSIAGIVTVATLSTIDTAGEDTTTPAGDTSE